jgi:hypothetical protein
MTLQVTDKWIYVFVFEIFCFKKKSFEDLYFNFDSFLILLEKHCRDHMVWVEMD